MGGGGRSEQCFTPGIQVGEVRLSPPESSLLLAVLAGEQVLGGLPFLERAHQPALVFQAVVPLQEPYIIITRRTGQRRLVLASQHGGSSRAGRGRGATTAARGHGANEHKGDHSDHPAGSLRPRAPRAPSPAALPDPTAVPNGTGFWWISPNEVRGGRVFMGEEESPGGGSAQRTSTAQSQSGKRGGGREREVGNFCHLGAAKSIGQIPLQ